MDLKSHSLDGTALKCDNCNKNFNEMEPYLRHVKQCVHIRPHKCSICSYKFINRNDLIIHIRRKHTMERPFQCSYCIKGFATVSDLTIHKRIHTGEKPYSCDLCGQCFRASTILARHKKNIH